MPSSIITPKTKKDIFDTLKGEAGTFGLLSDNSLFEFINEIWDLRSMPSEDPRFSDAYGDTVQHIINNDDWDIDFIFTQRFKLFDDDEIFKKFIDSVVSPKFKKDEDEITKFVLLLNPYLEKDGFKLAISDFLNEIPVYTLQRSETINNLPLAFKVNDVNFFVRSILTGRSNRASSHEKPTIFPCFVLAFNNGWNDYTIKNEFSLFYYDHSENVDSIGQVKIMQNDKEKTTLESLPLTFTNLSEEFCSLGQSEDYYRILKRLLKRDFESVLYAIKDAAFFTEVQEKFEENRIFINSLIRYDEQERLLRVVKYKIYEYDLSRLYKFDYQFLPSFADTPITINFDFDTNHEFPNRIYAFIGKNGTGKTQLLTSLPLNISANKDAVFSPKTPLFSKVIAVSYSVFDTFKIPVKSASFNYVICGLRNDKGEQMTDRGLMLRFHNSWKQIKKMKRISQWRKILLNFIDKDLVNEFLVLKEATNLDLDENPYEVKIEIFNKLRKTLSSGQSITLYIITEIVSHIRLDSLILYDEPETHLHPNAITELMNTIYELVNQFQSYCIIATHSPIIIRELPSRSVFVVEREANVPSVRRIGLESFGENLSTLTDEVFGNKSVYKQYKQIIDQFIKEGKTYEYIVSVLQFDEIPLSLNTRLYIKGMIKATNERT
ncbi:ATP-binding protein [Mucilaginibacter pallidiroseus]|uniref:ATP-binding protein n=1 Tax=Mucilaginibacter pallidiroseus TaxID=2599295 RepID=A0A563U0U2_9SPHI|nr:AAA family ATPase [Mucilaginibacter pallidiroseus]TWR25265.1 ATP-binding protein [Mucilaginibacter pallidiroseus]